MKYEYKDLILAHFWSIFSNFQSKCSYLLSKKTLLPYLPRFVQDSYIGKMKSIQLFSLALLVAILGSWSCKTQKNSNPPPQKTYSLDEAEKQLRDIWVLEWMENIDVDTMNFAGGIPILELQPKDSIALGTTGCNNLNTKLIVEKDNKLSFKWLSTTKMYCLNSAEPTYLDYLTRVTNYNREGLKLTLLEEERPLLRYTKSD